MHPISKSDLHLSFSFENKSTKFESNLIFILPLLGHPSVFSIFFFATRALASLLASADTVKIDPPESLMYP